MTKNNYLRDEYSGFFDSKGMTCLAMTTNDTHTQRSIPLCHTHPLQTRRNIMTIDKIMKMILLLLIFKSDNLHPSLLNVYRVKILLYSRFQEMGNFVGECSPLLG